MEFAEATARQGFDDRRRRAQVAAFCSVAGCVALGSFVVLLSPTLVTKPSFPFFPRITLAMLQIHTHVVFLNCRVGSAAATALLHRLRARRRADPGARCGRSAARDRAGPVDLRARVRHAPRERRPDVVARRPRGRVKRVPDRLAGRGAARTHGVLAPARRFRHRQDRDRECCGRCSCSYDCGNAGIQRASILGIDGGFGANRFFRAREHGASLAVQGTDPFPAGSARRGGQRGRLRLCRHGPLSKGSSCRPAPPVPTDDE